MTSMERIEFRNSQNQKIVGVLQRGSSSKEVVIFIHGFSSNKDGGPKIMAEELASHGINSFRIDLDDQGESEPRLEDASITSYKYTVISAINKMKDLGFSKINLVGTSFGGAVALAVANEYPINKIVLRSPALDHYRRMLKIYGPVKLEEAEARGYIMHNNADGRTLKMDYNWIEDGKKYLFENTKGISAPILIIHGKDDDLVDYRESVAAAKQLPNAKLVLIPEATHWLGVNGDFSKSMSALIDWFKR